VEMAHAELFKRFQKLGSLGIPLLQKKHINIHLLKNVKDFVIMIIIVGDLNI